MARDGISVVCHKSTDGPRYYLDKYFPQAMTRVRDAGLVGGAYHVLWNNDLQTQIDWFVDTTLAAAPWASTEAFQWMLDCEPFGYNGGTPSVATIIAACDRLRSRLPNHRPLIYAPHWVYSNLSGLTCPVVASSYGNNPVAHYRDAYPGDGSTRWAAYGGMSPVMLQYGSQTKVGSQSTVDANAFRGTLDQFKATVYSGKPAPTPIQPGNGPAWPGVYYKLTSPMMHAPGIATWQNRMAQRGWSISADGWFGVQTQSVVRAFQRDKHLTVDDIIGNQTWTAAWNLPVTL